LIPAKTILRVFIQLIGRNKYSVSSYYYSAMLFVRLLLMLCCTCRGYFDLSCKQQMKILKLRRG